MSWVDRRRDLIKVLVLVVAVALTTQLVKYWAHVESVKKTLTSQLMIYHERGADPYRAAVLKELSKMGMVVDPSDLTTTEDRPNDEFRVELSYRWPLHVLLFQLERKNVARTRTTILDS